MEVSKNACLSVKSVQNYIVSQTKGGELKIWQQEGDSWTLSHVIDFDYWGFCKFDVSSHSCLICPESESTIKMFGINGKTENILKTPKANYGEIMALKCFTLLSTDYIFLLFESGNLSIFKICGSLISTYKITADCPMALDFDGVSKGIVGSSGDTIVGFELASDLQLIKWKETVITNPGVSSVVIRPDKKLFAAGCWDSKVRIFSMKSLKLLAVLENHKDSIQDVCYSPTMVQAWQSQWLLASAGKDGRITLWKSLY